MQAKLRETDRPDRLLEPTVDADTPASGLPEPTIDLPPDVVFGLLSNERRRRVLRYLLREEAETTLGVLAEHIAAVENDKPERALSSSERKRVYVALYQCHLPKMDDAGVIDFDEDRKTVAIAPGIDQLQPYLAVDEGPSGSTTSESGRYLWLTAVGAGSFVVQSLLFPAAWLSGLILGALLTVVGLAAVAHLVRSDPRVRNRGLSLP